MTNKTYLILIILDFSLHILKGSWLTSSRILKCLAIN